MHVLTFNSHQPYIHLLADSLPWTFGVVTPRLATGRVKDWDVRIRPLLGNIRLYRSVEVALLDSSWDWVLTHNANDLIDSSTISLPKVFLVHGTLSGRIVQDGANIDRKAYVANLRRLLEVYKCSVVYISELKERDWGIPGEIIKTAVNPAHYGGYRGDHAAVLQVSNHLKERGAMLGWEIHREVCGALPSIVLGDNPGLPDSRMSDSWEDLKEQYRSCRVYLHTALYPHEDGYNLAVLEAMATGMPIATIEHPTSPIDDGVEGVVAGSAAALRGKVIRLLDNPHEAASLGRSARRKLETAFPLSEFRSAWQELASRLV